MKYDPAFVEINDEIRGIIAEAYIMHGRSYHALARTLNYEHGISARKLVTGERKYINKEKLKLLKCLVEHGDGTRFLSRRNL